MHSYLLFYDWATPFQSKSHLLVLLLVSPISMHQLHPCSILLVTFLIWFYVCFPAAAIWNRILEKTNCWHPLFLINMNHLSSTSSELTCFVFKHSKFRQYINALIYQVTHLWSHKWLHWWIKTKGYLPFQLSFFWGLAYLHAFSFNVSSFTKYFLSSSRTSSVCVTVSPIPILANWFVMVHMGFFVSFPLSTRIIADTDMVRHNFGSILSRLARKWTLRSFVSTFSAFPNRTLR